MCVGEKGIFVWGILCVSEEGILCESEEGILCVAVIVAVTHALSLITSSSLSPSLFFVPWVRCACV